MAIENDGLFKLVNQEHEQGAIRTTFEINRQSGILKGHFPGHPVVPGASMLQLIKEVLEDALGSPLLLKQGDQLKFMALVDPENTSSVDLEIIYEEDNGVINVQANLSSPDVVHFKFQGSFAVSGE